MLPSYTTLRLCEEYPSFSVWEDAYSSEKLFVHRLKGGGCSVGHAEPRGVGLAEEIQGKKENAILQTVEENGSFLQPATPTETLCSSGAESEQEKVNLALGLGKPMGPFPLGVVQMKKAKFKP